MKNIKIEINHNLTPFHEEVLLNSIKGIVAGLHIFWTNKSKKKFEIFYDIRSNPLK